MALWCWIMRICQEFANDAAGPPPHAPQLIRIFQCCLSARNGIHTINTYLLTQLPFAYVHLISLLVFLNNGIVCVRCSAEFVGAVYGSDEPQWDVAGYQIFQLVL